MQQTLDLPSSPQVISASRRTDIPAYHGRWLLARLAEGRCEVRQPFSGALREVDLRPAAVLALVMWTRDPRPLLDELEGLVARDYPFVMLVTVNAYPAWMEPGAPDPAALVEALRGIRSAFGPAAVVWRYDPIVLTSVTPPQWHVQQVERLAAQLAGVADECVTSFVDLYRKTERNLLPAAQHAGAGLLEADADRDTELLRAMKECVAGHGLTLSSCCQAQGLDAGLAQARCVDPARLGRLLQREVRLPRRPSRPGCGCHASVDIGAYDTCPRGCVYCYATRSPAAGRAGAAASDVASRLLGGRDRGGSV